MTLTLGTAQRTALRRAAVRATLAPSVHNTQPWRFHVTAGALEVHADRTRRLPVLDPTSRQLLMSCGCAIMMARVSLAGDHVATDVMRSDAPLTSRPLAVLPVGADEIDPDLARLDPMIERRHSNRRGFIDARVVPEVLDVLQAAAAAEGASLHVVPDPVHRIGVVALSRRAERIANLNPAYRAELRAWSTGDSGRADGAPGIAVAPVDGIARCLAVVCTARDTPSDWLRAGEALGRVLLEITRHGYSALPLTQVTEVPVARAHLRRRLGMSAYPHVLLRIGRGPEGSPSRRRRLADVIVED